MHCRLPAMQQHNVLHHSHPSASQKRITLSKEHTIGLSHLILDIFSELHELFTYALAEYQSTRSLINVFTKCVHKTNNLNAI